MRELVFIGGDLLMGKGVPMLDGSAIEGNRDASGCAIAVSTIDVTTNVLMK